MRLKSFRVTVFRNIIDSGEVDVEQVTCLVGKNEAGKSALLQALHHLNPAKPPVTLSLLDEYPRWLKKQHEITGEIDGATPIKATFELDASELGELEERFGEGVLKSNAVRMSRRYGDESFSISAELDLTKFIKPFVASLPQRVQREIGEVGTTSDLRKRLADLSPADPEDEVAAALAADAADAISRLDDTFGTDQNLTQAVEAFIRTRTPRTFYFSTFASLLGRYDFDEVFAAVQAGSDGSVDDPVQTAADFLRLARTVSDTIEDWDFEAAVAELEAVSSLLTQRVTSHWKQNDHLKLRVNVETQREGAKPNELVRRYLQFRVEDTRHDFSSRLDRRSTGFQWFVSFIASFLEFEKDKDLILLLDEPGLSLHARAQMNLLDTIQSDLAADRQVLFTTHSPFMVKTTQLNATRIVEDQGPQVGSVVTNDAGRVSDPDTLFPLQAALGYDVVQSLFIGTRNVLVEGVSDFVYLTMISEHLRSAGRPALPEDCRLLPAGGVTNIPTFIALLGGQLDVVVLVDGAADRTRIETSITGGRLDAAKVISLDGFSTVPGADIEDLFDPQEYLDLYNAAFGKKLKLSDLKGKDRIVKRIARAEEGDFNHGVVAAHFLRHLEESLAALSGDTLDRFEAVCSAVAGALPPP